MNRRYLAIAAILGALTVIIGAFGAHGLKSILIENGKLEVFETAVNYQMMHTLSLLIVGFHFETIRLANWVSNCWIIGVFIFSGSLYALSITNVSILGAITPIGGTFFIIGWGVLIYSILKK
ncbi:DUF423 domain-containing protein [Reichenbachiella versicolor]|uniref:DUF423 domain-containing protein n=1 Tax=Reichenbachiella versicolor TaxID=1821036 RepID=UPI000D6EA2A8|nr:DUF423 domain-containing protein [Reichenbachiella versicolor]